MAHGGPQGGVGKRLPDRRHFGAQLRFGITVVLCFRSGRSRGPVIYLPGIKAQAQVEGQRIEDPPLVLSKARPGPGIAAGMEGTRASAGIAAVKGDVIFVCVRLVRAVRHPQGQQVGLA